MTLDFRLAWAILVGALLMLWSLYQGALRSTLQGIASVRNNSKSLPTLSNEFATLDDALEMATASMLVYAFRNEPSEEVCDKFNAREFNTTTMSFLRMPEYEALFSAKSWTMTQDLLCHWYLHDPIQGTQVMLVSSKSKQYNAIVFAGTDNMRTVLTDANILTTSFGDGNVSLPDDEIHVHEGFNQALFANGIYTEVRKQFLDLQAQYPNHRIFTTGHSLGAAESVLVALALAVQQQDDDDHVPSNSEWFVRRRPKQQSALPLIQNINFGCPRIGNAQWRTYLHDPSTVPGVAIWRVVLGWDLVPRLPELFYHVGHTIQLTHHDGNGTAYYHHVGNETLGWRGVPFGWSAKPYLWVPGALLSHHVGKYWALLHQWKQQQHNASAKGLWPMAFAESSGSFDDNDDRPPNVDDDFWVDPPDDDFEYDKELYHGVDESTFSSSTAMS